MISEVVMNACCTRMLIFFSASQCGWPLFHDAHEFEPRPPTCGDQDAIGRQAALALAGQRTQQQLLALRPRRLDQQVRERVLAAEPLARDAKESCHAPSVAESLLASRITIEYLCAA